MVIEDLDFNHKGDWFCIEGGSQEIAKRAEKYVEKKQKERGRDFKIQYHKKVTAISYIDPDGDPRTKEPITAESQLTIQFEDMSDEEFKAEPPTYDAVFNSVPLGAMQHMHLEGLRLHYGVKQAIRSLGYGASCKVGVKFKEMWWLQDKFNIRGGASKTDLPIRCCVYPSYNIDDAPADGGVLLVSYTWSQEAQRIAALINRKSPNDENELKRLLLHDLARLHTDSDDEYTELYDKLDKLYETHYAYDWYADPTTCGAFAYFGPAQFKNMYPFLTRCDGKHVIIGEAASAHHAWVVGALESAVRGVYQFLFRHSGLDWAANLATLAYNHNSVPGPFGPLPAEYTRPKDCDFLGVQKSGDEKQQVKLPEASKVEYTRVGDFARIGVLFESIRKVQDRDQLVGGDIQNSQIAPILHAISATHAAPSA